MKKATVISFYLLIWCITAANFIQVSCSIDFILTIETDKAVYSFGETVIITGNLTLGGNATQDALIAIQVNNPVTHLVYRTIYIPPIIKGDLNRDEIVDIFDIAIIALAYASEPGDENWNPAADVNGDGIIDIFDLAVVALDYGRESSSGLWKIEILDVYLCDNMGNPLANATKNSTSTIAVKYKNSQTYPILAVIAFTIYDSNNTPVKVHATTEYVQPKTVGGAIYVSWTVPAEAQLGTATVYASAYTKYPKDGGFPHCPEKSGTFNIVSADGQSNSTGSYVAPAQNSGSFTTSLRIPSTGDLALNGTYTVYATAFLYPYLTSTSTTYEVNP